MLARYRYRIEPAVAQREMLARTFGCVRTVFNDAVRCREAAYRTGVELTPTEVQRRVITEAKTRGDRAWLAEVASVALVQSVRDAHRAYQNYFESAAGTRRGRKVGKPRFKSRKDNRQSFRLTRNGFTIRPSGQIHLAKIGDMRVRWSRELPSEPSSVTIIREPDGHYYASFVVEVEPTPLAPIAHEAGIDLGIIRLAVVATTAGHRIDITNLRSLRHKLRKLRRLEQARTRRAKGSKNREKARRKVAALHCKVARARLDHHHKQALGLIRENQAVYVEDLNVAGMARNHRLARAVHDAGWAQFVQLIEDKAKKYGRTVAKVSRWLPTSKTCSDCGYIAGDMPLNVRNWMCPTCGATHDRDYNAARNILAAGRAERLNACGAQVRPPVRERHRAMNQEAPERDRAERETPVLKLRSKSIGSALTPFTADRTSVLCCARGHVVAQRGT